MRAVRPGVLAAGLFAGLTICSAAAAEVSEERWIRIAEIRLDDQLDANPPTGWAPPGWRIGEATLTFAPDGRQTGWTLTRSTGDRRDDREISTLARYWGDMPPPPPSLAGRPLVLRVAYYMPPPLSLSRLDGRIPTRELEVLIEEPPVAEGPKPIVITAAR